MKVLFISSKDVTKTGDGGELCTNRNYESFCIVAGIENVSIYYLNPLAKTGVLNAFFKRINYIKGYYEGLDKVSLKDIVDLSYNHECIFIDSSIHGNISKFLRRYGYKGKIICFFHNLEYKIKMQKLKSTPWKLLETLVTYSNEKSGVRYSDTLVALNYRDVNELKRMYDKKDYKVIPISLKDRLKSHDLQAISNTRPVLLFNGNNWYPNIQALDWFISKVLDRVEIQLQISGRNMESYREKYKHKKIDFLGFVDNLDQTLKDADFMLFPIFIGSGMKVKTCEALMFGKNIIGTTEAFEGYNVDPEKIGALCNTADEFVDAINRLKFSSLSKFNENSRGYFEKYYSFEATIKMFRELL